MIGYQKVTDIYYNNPDKPCYIPRNAVDITQIFSHLDLLHLVGGLGHMCGYLFNWLSGESPSDAIQKFIESGTWVVCPNCGRYYLAADLPAICDYCETMVEAPEVEEEGLPTIPYTIQEFAQLLADSSDGWVYDVALDAKGNGAGYITDVKRGNTRYLLFDFYDGPAGMMSIFDLNLYKETSVETLIQDLEDWIDGLPISEDDKVYVFKENLCHEEE